MSFKDHFSSQAAIYAQARPTYPAAWFAELAKLTPGHDLAWDAGAGNGQASTGLAAHFARVIATEPSAAQWQLGQPGGQSSQGPSLGHCSCSALSVAAATDSTMSEIS